MGVWRWAAVVALGWVVAGYAQEAPPAPAVDVSAIDALAKQALAEWQVPGFAIAVVHKDKLVLARGYGVRELNKPEANDADTLFAIASCSKAFCATTLAQLVADGKLKWDDPAQKYLPSLQLYDPYVSAKLSVRDLVSHRSGLATFSGDLLWYQSTYSRAEILSRLRYLKPVAGFRERFGYQNNLFLAAGEIVPVVSGKSWDDFVRERIFLPLEMQRTTTRHAQWIGDPNHAVPHGWIDDAYRVVPPCQADNVAPAAAVNTSANDISNWLRMNLNQGKFAGKTVVPADAFRQLWQPVTVLPVRGGAPAGERAPTHLKAYALGWFVSDFHGRLRVEHDGSLDGMMSKVALLPEEQFGVAVLTNSDTPLADVLVSTLLDRIVGAKDANRSKGTLARVQAMRKQQKAELKRTEAARKTDTHPSLPLPKYAGSYGGPLYGDVTVTLEGEKLVLRMLPTPSLVADLEHWQHDTFRMRWRTKNPYIPDGWANFVLDRKGQIAEVKLDAPNDDFDFTELELKRK